MGLFAMKRGLGKNKKQVREIRVSYGQTRRAARDYEFDRLDVGTTRDLLPGEDRDEAMREEVETLEMFVKAYMAGEI